MSVEQREWSRRTILTSGVAGAGIALWETNAARALALPRADPIARDLDAIAKAAETAIQAGRATGISISVAKGGAILWEGGIGTAARDPALAATPHTPFCLASITKIFTAAAVMRLVEAGKLDLDAPIDRYLPTPLPRSRFATQAVTLRLLGGHCGGLPSLFDMFDPKSPPPAINELIHGYGELAYPAGERYEYANLGYSLLGAAISRATGRDFSDSLNDLVIRPMGLRDTFFDSDRSRMAGAAGRFDENGNNIPFYLTGTPPSGEVYASAHDLNIFASHMMGITKKGRRPFLGPNALAPFYAPVSPQRGKAFTTFGWSGLDSNGQRIIIKTGGQPGVSTRLTLLPTQQISIAVLSNRNDNRQIVSEITSKIASLLEPGWSDPDYRVDDFSPPNTLPETYEGSWSGSIRQGGRSEAVSVVIDGGGASRLTVGNAAPRSLRELTSSSYALEFSADGGMNDGRDRGAGTRQLAFKLVKRDEQLFGRCLEMFSRPGFTSTMPHIVSLSRSS